MGILSVVDNRPQLLAAASLSLALRECGVTEVVVHTGRQEDEELEASLLEELELPPPAYRVDAGPDTDGEQTGRQLPAIEAAVLAEKPYAVLVFGDSNSTLASRTRCRQAARPRRTRRRRCAIPRPILAGRAELRARRPTGGPALLPDRSSRREPRRRVDHQGSPPGRRCRPGRRERLREDRGFTHYDESG